jgi:hypothetical protein
MVFRAYYIVPVFNIKIRISKKTFLGNISLPKFKIGSITDNEKNKYKEYAAKYLAYELVSIKKDMSKSVCNSFLNDRDLKFFIDSLNPQSFSNGKFQGEGGYLEIETKPLQRCVLLFLYSIVKIMIYAALMFSILYFCATYDMPIIAFLLFVPFYFIVSEIKKSKTIYKELRYDR